MWADEPETPEELLIRKRHAEELRAIIDQARPRTRAMFQEWAAGATYREIGASHGVSSHRARQLCVGLIDALNRLDPDVIARREAARERSAEESARRAVAIAIAQAARQDEERAREREFQRRVDVASCDPRWGIAATLHFFTGRPPDICGMVQGLPQSEWIHVWSAWGRPRSPSEMPPMPWRYVDTMDMEEIARACDAFCARGQGYHATLPVTTTVTPYRMPRGPREMSSREMERAFT